MEASFKTSADSDGDAIVHRVLSAVADIEDCDVLDLPPLERVIDVQALTRVAEGPGVTEIMFSYHGHRVQIDGDGDVTVTPSK